MRLAVAAALVLLSTGCQQKLSSVHGWNGPPASVMVDRSGAQITLECPTSGWVLSIDRSHVEGATAQVFVTARRPAGMALQVITPMHLDWRPANGPAPECVQAMVRIDDGSWMPAAEGCR